MELVKGVSITRYCDEKHLPLRARLELFMQVCQAVQHAHQKGIIHRDIKPNNVLVAEYDNEAIPKVIDFGVAKATAQKLTERTMFTEFGQVLGTMEYMSPEQSKFNQLDIDTRSDIYSLGVLLYELLAGSTPFEGKRLHDAAFDEMLRIIREEEPPKPSTRLSKTDQLPNIAASRDSEPKKLSGLVKGELDWVVMKALEKDRNRRYDTANSFAMDVQRYLADDPVQACPPSAGYRLRKLARRNKVALTTALVILMVLVAGTVVSTWQAIRALDAEALAQQRLEAETHARQDADGSRQQAENERDRARKAEQQADDARQQAEANFQKALDAVDQMLTEVGRESLAHVPQMEPVRRALLEKALQFYQDFLQQKGSDARLRFETGRAYQRVSDIYWRLGQKPEAVEACRQAIDILEKLEAEFPEGVDYRDQLGQCYRHLAFRIPWREEGGKEEAEAAFRQAITRHEQLVAHFPGEAAHRETLAYDYNTFAYFLVLSRPLEAESTYYKAIALLEDLMADFPEAGSYRVGLAEVSRALGVMLWTAHRLPDAEQSLRRAVILLEKPTTANPDSPRHGKTLARSQFHLGQVLESAGRTDEAEEVYRAAELIQEKLFADFPSVPEYKSELSETRECLVRLSDAAGRTEEANEYLEKAVRLNPGNAATQNKLAWRLATSLDPNDRDPERAVKLAQEAVELAPTVADWWNTLGVAQYRAGKWQEAIAALQRHRELRTDDAEWNNPFFLAMAHQQLGNKDEAVQWYNRAIDWMERKQAKSEMMLRSRAEAAELLGIENKH
jgi:tetratricopeptide (TPR) repeat protein